MNPTFVEQQASRSGERGGARLKFLIVIVILGAVAYAGYLYIPIQFDAYRFKDLMQRDVDMAVAQGSPASWVVDQLTKSAAEYNVPPDAVITPTQQDNRMEVRVQFTRPIELPGYTYRYEFDYTAKSTSFITVK